MNEVRLEGFAGGDAETTRFASGKMLTKLRLATKENWDGGERTDWHNIVQWGEHADLKLITKGCRVRVTGSIRYRTYEKDGARRYVTEIAATDVEKLSHSNKRGDDN